MRLILGIGNPGRRYQKNRHNVGFMFLDYLADNYSISFVPSKGDYFSAQSNLAGNQFCLIKPSTFVNNSGYSALQAITNYDVQLEDLLVVYDDVYLPISEFRVRLAGGDGGHNGIKSIIFHLLSENFNRLRIGVRGNDYSQENLVDYVLSDFTDEELNIISSVFKKCTLLAEAFILGGTKQLLDVNSTLGKSEIN